MTCPQSHRWILEAGPKAKAGWFSSDTVRVHMAVLASVDKGS